MTRINLSLSLMMGVTLILGCASGTKAEQGETEKRNRAVSLRVLQDRVQACEKGRTCSAEVLALAELGWLDGYVIDPVNHDLILVGQVVEGVPPLHLEDFVVALRDAWGLYRWREGNTIYSTDPGCSIDPHPKVMGELQRIGDYLNERHLPAHEKEALDYWHKVCHMPQQVRVLGIPFNTHFAKVMVDADYFMKKLVDGSETLRSIRFRSLSDLHIEQFEKAMREGKQGVMQLDNMSRFWFHAGEAILLEDPGMVEI